MSPKKSRSVRFNCGTRGGFVPARGSFLPGSDRVITRYVVARAFKRHRTRPHSLPSPLRPPTRWQAARCGRFRAHTPRAPDSLVPRHRARASKELRARRDRGAQRLLTAIPKNTLSFQKQPVTNARRRAEPDTNRPKREASPEQPLTQPTARRHPFGQVEKY